MTTAGTRERVSLHDARPAYVLPARESSVRRALDQLRRKPAAFAALVFLASLIFVSVFAELLAADLPLFARIGGKTFVLPAVTRPPELAKQNCQTLERSRTAADTMVFPPVRYGAETRAEGGAGHLLGTDAKGRDVFARAVYATRTTVTLALACALAFVFIGTLFGAAAGFFGGIVDGVLTRLIETLTAFPPLVLVLAIQAMLPKPTLLTMLAVIGLIRWPEIARVVRAEMLSVVSRDYVTAARALGASPLRILTLHVAPNVKGPVLVAVTFALGSVVLVEASLSFLHVGVPEGTPSWGAMLSDVSRTGGSPWLLVLPGVLLFSCLVSINAVAEALRDLLDPRLASEAPEK